MNEIGKTSFYDKRPEGRHFCTKFQKTAVKLSGREIRRSNSAERRTVHFAASLELGQALKRSIFLLKRTKAGFDVDAERFDKLLATLAARSPEEQQLFIERVNKKYERSQEWDEWLWRGAFLPSLADGVKRFYHEGAERIVPSMSAVARMLEESRLCKVFFSTGGKCVSAADMAVYYAGSGVLGAASFALPCTVKYIAVAFFSVGAVAFGAEGIEEGKKAASEVEESVSGLLELVKGKLSDRMIKDLTTSVIESVRSWQAKDFRDTIELFGSKELFTSLGHKKASKLPKVLQEQSLNSLFEFCLSMAFVDEFAPRLAPYMWADVSLLLIGVMVSCFATTVRVGRPELKEVAVGVLLRGPLSLRSVLTKALVLKVFGASEYLIGRFSVYVVRRYLSYMFSQMLVYTKLVPQREDNKGASKALLKEKTPKSRFPSSET